MILRLGFIGLGIMGAPMVRRLRDRGWPVTVWNLEPDRFGAVADSGAEWAGDPAAVRARSDVTVLCVLDGGAVEACCFGPNGLAHAPGGAGLLIDTSTINPDQTLSLAARLRAEADMAWVDAPMSGGPDAARAGSLTMMVGGEPASVALAEPVLRDLAANLTVTGPLGTGQTAKILNQAIVGVGYVLMAELLALAERTALDVPALPGALAGGMADSTVLQRIFPQMQARAFEPPKGYARQLDKDLRSVAALVHGLGLELPVLEAAIAQYAAYTEAGHGLEDSASVMRLYERPAEPG